MNNQTSSSWRVSYDLRPAKQVERRMFVDTLHILSRQGFPITDYKYIGFGAYFFVDFVLFHKLLGIKEMLSVERDETLQKRIEFNKPFDFIDISYGPVHDIIPELNPDKKYIVWLDYDGHLDKEKLTDIESLASKLSVGSILIVTLNAGVPRYLQGKSKSEWYGHFENEVGFYFDASWTKRNFTKDQLASYLSKIVKKALDRGLASRSDVNFYPLFHFNYRDGAKMLTLGGIIGSNEEKKNCPVVMNSDK